jgi:hypothetical protein
LLPIGGDRFLASAFADRWADTFSQPGFAAAVAGDGALPFIALALADGERSMQMLRETSALPSGKAGRAWTSSAATFTPACRGAWGEQKRIIRYYLHRWPSQRSMNRLREKIRARTGRNRCGDDIRDVIADLNPLLRGWGNYFRTGNAAGKFRQADDYVV